MTPPHLTGGPAAHETHDTRVDTRVTEAAPPAASPAASPAATSDTPRPMTGRVIGNYVLGAPLGRGGTSEVFAATHRFLGGEVAIKLLHPHVATSATASVAFLAEAQRTRAIRHPGIVEILDFGRDAELGAHYLVMPCLPGESLADRLPRDGRMAEEAARVLAASIADAMAAAHAADIAHLDLKPANVIVDGERPTIVDFGIARHALDPSTGRAGTPAYMAPEQLRGDRLGPAADIWALGVLVYELVTGGLPFARPRPDEPPPALSIDPTPPSAIAGTSRELDTIILACLARDPARRPASMTALAAQLRTGTLAALAPLPPKRRAWRLGLAVIAAIAAIAIGVTAAIAITARHAAPILPAPPVARAPAPVPLAPVAPILAPASPPPIAPVVVRPPPVVPVHTSKPAIRTSRPTKPPIKKTPPPPPPPTGETLD